jgi:hypothetical protein
MDWDYWNSTVHWNTTGTPLVTTGLTGLVSPNFRQSVASGRSGDYALPSKALSKFCFLLMHYKVKDIITPNISASDQGAFCFKKK